MQYLRIIPSLLLSKGKLVKGKISLIIKTLVAQ